MATAAKAKQSAMVRVSEQSHHRLRELAAQSGESMQTVLEKALEQYRRQQFWKELDVAYAALASDPEAMAEYQAELAIWDCTLMDGLDPNEVWTEADFCLPAEEKVA
jgi:phage terminase large subunit-like protein